MINWIKKHKLDLIKLSKLANLRAAGAKAAPTIFSNTVSSDVADVFKRIQEGKPSRSYEKKKWKPSRFKCDKPKKELGETSTTKQLIILDTQVSYAQAEHSVKHYSADYKGGFQWQTERCISAVDACPICSMPKHNPSDKLIVTVLDLTPWSYTDKEGNKVEKEFTKRELAFGSKQLPLFQSMARDGSLRGVLLNMTRGSDALEAGHGVPTFVQQLTEEELLEMFGHEEIKATGDDGKEYIAKAENADITPFDYQKIHTLPSRSDLATKYGVAPRPGSLEELKQEEIEQPTWEEQVNLLELDEGLPEID